MLSALIWNFLRLAAYLTVLFVLVSFIINLLQQLIPYHKLEQYLFSKNPVLGALVALIFAFLTPFCSCSTVPLVVNMLQKKIRFSIVMIFLFTSPVLDPTILTLMAVLLGWKVAAVFTFTTSVLGVIIGFGLERFGFQRYIKSVIMSGFHGEPKNEGRLDPAAAFRTTWTLMRTVYPYLIIGAVIGSGIKELVPTEWITAYFGGEQWWLIPAAAIVGIPLYIRLSTMIPISQIMIAKGMALGPVMALMISSAGASLPEVAMLGAIFRKELVAAFVVSVITMATLSGTIFYLI